MIALGEDLFGFLLRLRLAVAAQNENIRNEAHLAPVRRSPRADVSNLSLDLFWSDGAGEIPVTVTSSELFASRGTAGIVEQRALRGLRIARALPNGEVLTGIVKPVGRPELVQYLDELGRLPVALIMRKQRNAEHAEVILDPAADEVEPPAAVADLVERGTDTGDDAGVEKRGVDSRDNLEPRGHHGQGRGSCERVERGAPEP